ncbi:hypothetical protein KO465_00455 [Candidatus Micrarchaeota archaeon]|jgi:hypothetical protein|nr:hypothetical protein [Candidatus Micrarchaeota archaeon]
MKGQLSSELIVIISVVALLLLSISVIYVEYYQSSYLFGDAVNCEHSVRKVATTINSVATIRGSSEKISLNSQRCVFGVYDRIVYGLYSETPEGHSNRISEYILTNATQEAEFNAFGDFIIKNEGGVIKIEEA